MELTPGAISLVLIWLITLSAGIISLRMYQKLPIPPYAYQTLALWSVSFCGLCIVLGLILNIIQFM